MVHDAQEAMEIPLVVMTSSYYTQGRNSSISVRQAPKPVHLKMSISNEFRLNKFKIYRNGFVNWFNTVPFRCINVVLLLQLLPS